MNVKLKKYSRNQAKEPSLQKASNPHDGVHGDNKLMSWHAYTSELCVVVFLLTQEPSGPVVSASRTPNRWPGSSSGDEREPLLSTQQPRRGQVRRRKSDGLRQNKVSCCENETFVLWLFFNIPLLLPR